MKNDTEDVSKMQTWQVSFKEYNTEFSLYIV